MDRFTHMTRQEVTCGLALAGQITLARKALADLALSAMDNGRLDLLDQITRAEDAIPVAAYVRPVKRWAGGSQDEDLWYWDRP